MLREAQKAFNHSGKLNAIVTIATEVEAVGFDEFRESVISGQDSFLSAFPTLGPATSLHLLKDLGLLSEIESSVANMWPNHIRKAGTEELTQAKALLFLWISRWR